jgi:hypothetical protein
MANTRSAVSRILCEETGDLAGFLQSRKEGAEKLRASAEEAGGPAQLTAQHFAAKDKPYKEAIDLVSSGSLSSCLNRALVLAKALANIETMSQTQFQALTGQLEAYGEAYIVARDLDKGLHLPGSTPRVPEDFDSDSLEDGIAVEMEHTDDPAIAKNIAMDHLAEDPDYYKKLRKMEAT